MKISKLKKGDIILVKWNDSMATGRWYDETEVDTWMKAEETCKSAGFFYKANKQSIAIHLNISPSEYGNLTIIPIKVIRNIKLLKRSK